MKEVSGGRATGSATVFGDSAGMAEDEIGNAAMKREWRRLGKLAGRWRRSRIGTRWFTERCEMSLGIGQIDEQERFASL